LVNDHSEADPPRGRYGVRGRNRVLCFRVSPQLAGAFVDHSDGAHLKATAGGGVMSRRNRSGQSRSPASVGAERNAIFLGAPVLRLTRYRIPKSVITLAAMELA